MLNHSGYVLFDTTMKETVAIVKIKYLNTVVLKNCVHSARETALKRIAYLQLRAKRFGDF